MLARWQLCVLLSLIAIFLPTGIGFAQEVGFLDVTEVDPRLELRSPEVKARENEVIRRSLTEMIGCDPSEKSAGVLQSTLLGLDRSDYKIGDRPRFELRIQNVGQVPVRVPFSPHLSDIQSAGSPERLTYSLMVVELWIGGARWDANTGGRIDLFGAEDHPSTLVTLRPGEWVRIIGKGNIHRPQAVQSTPVDRAKVRASIYEMDELLAARATATSGRHVCLSEKQGQSIPITLSEAK
jgi:hypothetical protein